MRSECKVVALACRTRAQGISEFTRKFDILSLSQAAFLLLFSIRNCFQLEIEDDATDELHLFTSELISTLSKYSEVN